MKSEFTPHTTGNQSRSDGSHPAFDKTGISPKYTTQLPDIEGFLPV
jgi:hypothetical protein